MRNKKAKAMRKAVYGNNVSLHERKYVVTEYRQYHKVPIDIPDWEIGSERANSMLQCLDALQTYAEKKPDHKVETYVSKNTMQAVQHRGIYQQLKKKYKRKEF